jgi:hypothetical protein
VPVVATPAGAVPLPLTDLEEELRTRAAALATSTSPFAGALPPIVPDITRYGDALRARPYASSEARFARIGDDIGDDRLRLESFMAVADKVAARDAIRRRARGYVPAGPSEGDALATRMADNEAVVAGTLAVLDQRAAAYRYALEHLVLATPSPAAVGAEHALLRFEQDLAGAG